VKDGATIWDLVQELPTDMTLKTQLLHLFCKAQPGQGLSRTDSAINLDLKKGSKAATPNLRQEIRIFEGTILRCGREGALSKLPAASLVARALLEFKSDELLSGEREGQSLAELLRLLHDNACPTAQQKQILEEAKALNPDKPFGNIERYMWELSRVPAYNERLECWQYLTTWEEDLRPVRSNIEQFETVVKCFRSPALPQLLGVVLTVGNFMNGGTKDGRADGFHLSLLKPGGIDAVRDNQCTGNLRRFVISAYLEKCRKGAAALLVDLRPALKNIKRSLENVEGGGLRLVKQVKVSLERTCDEALSRIQAEFAERKRMLQVVKEAASVEGDTSTGERMQAAFDRAGVHLEELQRHRDRAADCYAQLLGWLHHTTQEPSEAFFLLWDDFLIPSECFEAQGPSKVKSMLKPLFCDDSGDIDVYSLGRLWEVNVGGLPQRSQSVDVRSGSAARSSSAAPCSARNNSVDDIHVEHRRQHSRPPQDARPPHAAAGGSAAARQDSASRRQVNHCTSSPALLGTPPPSHAPEAAKSEWPPPASATGLDGCSTSIKPSQLLPSKIRSQSRQNSLGPSPCKQGSDRRVEVSPGSASPPQQQQHLPPPSGNGALERLGRYPTLLTSGSTTNSPEKENWETPHPTPPTSKALLSSPLASPATSLCDWEPSGGRHSLTASLQADKPTTGAPCMRVPCTWAEPCSQPFNSAQRQSARPGKTSVMPDGGSEQRLSSWSSFVPRKSLDKDRPGRWPEGHSARADQQDRLSSWQVELSPEKAKPLSVQLDTTVSDGNSTRNGKESFSSASSLFVRLDSTDGEKEVVSGRKESLSSTRSFERLSFAASRPPQHSNNEQAAPNGSSPPARTVCLSRSNSKFEQGPPTVKLTSPRSPPPTRPVRTSGSGLPRQRSDAALRGSIDARLDQTNSPSLLGRQRSDTGSRGSGEFTGPLTNMPPTMGRQRSDVSLRGSCELAGPTSNTPPSCGPPARRVRMGASH